MQQLLKRTAWLAVLAMSARISCGFALIGPLNEAYQAPVIGYGLNYTSFASPGGPVALQDSSGPKNIAQEYRRTMPILYFSFDDNFMGFFGPYGSNAVYQAFQVYNNLTNVSMYSPDLSEFPGNAQEINSTAYAMSLTDVKSTTMHLIAEQLGLSQPERYTWTLHDRTHVGNVPCPAGMGYLVIQRNFGIVPSDLDALQYSSYVNDTLYTYIIEEACTGPNPLALAVPVAVDPSADTYTSIAADAPSGLQIGGYYTGLTRDDMGGLRYLMRANNINFEDAGPGTVEFVTNNLPAIITNQDLGLFAAQAATNGPAALLALYPGLIITSTNTSFGLTVTTNITEMLTNSPYGVAGSVFPFFTTNRTTNVIQFFQYTFGNLVTNTFSTRGLVGTVFLSLSNQPYAPPVNPPTVVTNTRFAFVNGVFGSFFLLPTNLCGVQILSNLFTQVIATTNLPVGGLIATNLPAGGPATNPAVVFTPGTIGFFTNHTLVYLPVTCPVNPVEKREGIEKITFVPRHYDSVLGQFDLPVTNDYTLYASVFTNGVTIVVPEHIQRVVTRPDFLFSAADLAIGPGGNNFNGKVTRGFNFNQTVNANGASGPGTIEPQTLFTFNEVGTIFWNGSAYSPILPTIIAGIIAEGSQSNAIQSLQWASFDGTTNAPILYPNGTTMTLVTITTTSLPDATVGSPYSAPLSATGGVPPYTWSISPTSPALPAGLTLSTNGIISGTPTGPAATYDFSVRATDSVGQFVDGGLQINVNP
jgi:hypothetical protein